LHTRLYRLIVSALMYSFGVRFDILPKALSK
jgi:hypothetical protein